MFLSRQGTRRRLRKRNKSLCSIGIAVLASSSIPANGFFNILRLANTDFSIVPHGEFSSRKTFFGGFFCKGKREGFVLVETSTRGIRVRKTTEEPLAERHVCLRLALLASKAVVLDAEERIERKRGLGVFIGMAELVLGRRKVEESSTFEVFAGVLERISGEGCEGVSGDGCLCEFVQEEKGIGVGRLRDLDSGKTSCSLQKGDGSVDVDVEAELSQKMCHSHAL